MKKLFHYYAVCWILLAALFNVVVFIVPKSDALGGAFWAGYLLIMLSLVGQLLCAYVAFKEKNRQKVFYRLSLVTVSYSLTVLSAALGALCMVLPGLPSWVGIVICVLLLGVHAIAVVSAKAAADLVSGTDDAIAKQTQFIRTMTAQAKALLVNAPGDSAKASLEKVFEALRYSDPMSAPALSAVERRMSDQFAALSQAVTAHEAEAVQTAAQAMLSLIQERSQACKLAK